MTKLQKIARRPHLSTLVASSISREIVEGRLKPGDQLPTEQSLAQTFGVSRNVIREAIARLRSEGQVWSHQGRGAFVSEPQKTADAVLKMYVDPITDSKGLAALFEFRTIVECQSAALAAERRSNTDLEGIGAALATMRTTPYGSVHWLTMDFDFHRRIAMATENRYIGQFMTFVADHVRDSILWSGDQSRSDELAKITLADHERILEAIADSDPVKASRAMKDHLAGAALRVGLPRKSA
jgi:DNA-binding FadR family transcriptional regulator